ncbi:MAG: PLP-dependent aspartate aminotransferase family protein [Methanomassiliicoccales archaeon]|jgi:methionine-gamma-lyase|nr:PLP-dependent aspartate aminotransferase family protein [Methanomassiliicoccales archaeon]
MEKQEGIRSGLSTVAVHAGERTNEIHGAVTTPIFQSSTFYFPTDDDKTWEGQVPDGSYIYTRYGNPTIRAAEDKIAALEGAEKGLAFSSGMAAITTTLMTFLRKGDHVVSIRDIYGGTFSFMKNELPKMGISVRFVDSSNPAEILEAIHEAPKIVYIESPTNPMLRIVDIPKIADAAHKTGAIVIADNTFATPVNQNPISMGVDIVVHSCTKYLNGHSDLIAGAVVGRKSHIDEIAKKRIVLGGVLDPFGAFLLLRGLKTLVVRMKKHNENGYAIAQYLEAHKKVERVYYPGLESHPQHALAKSLMRGFSGMVSFEVAGGRKGAEAVLKSLRLIKRATSLGGVESLASMPVNTSHAALSRAEREQLGIKDSLVRLSIGIEDAEDLMVDLDQALQHVS